MASSGPDDGGAPGDSRDGSPDGDDPRGPGEDGSEADDGWRFSLDDVDDEGIVRQSVEPGDPDPENVLFVLLGAIAMVLVFLRVWMLVG